MSTNKHNLLKKRISDICDQTHSLRAEITWLSTKDASSMQTHDQIMLFIEYIQVIAPLIIYNIYLQLDQETEFSKAIRYFSRVLDAASWLEFSSLNRFLITILSIFAMGLVLKFLLLGYIALVVRGKATRSRFLIQIWRYLFRIHGRLICSFVASFWSKAVFASLMTREEISDSQYYTTVGIASFFITLEFFYSLCLNICFVDILPSKHFLSSKDNIVETITLTQKLVVHILIPTLNGRGLSNLWVFAAMNLAFDVVRNLHFFKTLPLYRYKALMYQANFLMISTALTLSCLIGGVARVTDSVKDSVLLFLIFWIILSLLMVKCSETYLKKVFDDILLNPSIKSPNLLIHRISALKEVMKTENSRDGVHNPWKLLLKNCVNSRINDILCVNLDSENIQGQSKEGMNRIFATYLERLLEKNPNSQFLRLYTAHFSIKSLKLIRRPIEIIMKLQKNSRFHIGMNSELLLIEIQNNIKARYERLSEDKTNHLNISKFVYEKMLVMQAKEKIIMQADLQIKICNEIKKESPNLLQLLKDSQKLTLGRNETTKFIRKTMKLMSDYHIEPLLLYARYYLVLNHSMYDNTFYTRLYTRKLQKYQKYFDQDKLVEENIFSSEVSFVVFSHSKGSLGKVYYASKAMREIMGHTNESIFTMSLADSSPPCLYNFYNQYNKELLKVGEQGLTMGMTRGFLYTKEGYLEESDAYVNIHPFVTSEFYLNFVRKEVKSNREYMYVLGNGDIDSSTKGIGEKLGLVPSRKQTSPATEFNLKHISDELASVNDAFNMIYFAERTENEEVKTPSRVQRGIIKAQEIYSKYTTSGHDVWLSPVSLRRALGSKVFTTQEQDQSYLYNCKVTNIVMGEVFVKLFTFEEIQREARKMTTPKSEVIEPEFSQNETTEDLGEEKRDGWIDFNAMMSPRMLNIVPTSPGTNRTFNFDTNRKDTNRKLLETVDESPMLITKQSSKIRRDHSKGESTGGRNVKQIEAKNFRDEFGSRLSVGTSKWSKFSQAERISYLYEMAIKTRYAPKYYKIFFVLFFLAFVLLLACQFSLKSTLDENVEDLKVGKDVMRDAQIRTYQQIQVEFSTRLLWDYQSGRLTVKGFGIFASAAPILPALIVSNLVPLTETNQRLLSNTSTLAKEIRDKLFASDVLVYDKYFDAANQTFTKMNNFQAMNRVIETLFRLVKFKNFTNEESQGLMGFVVRNTLNDFLIKNDEICEMISDSLNNQRRVIETNIDAFLIALLLVFGGLLVLVVVILWKQYLKQMKNLSAFCRVNPKKLNEVLDEFIRFQEDIEDDENMGSGERSLKRRFNKRNQGEVIKGEYSKAPNAQDLQLSYYVLVSKLTLLIVIIMIAVTLSSIMNQKAISSSQTMQKQIYFLEYAKARTGILSTSLPEMTSTNNTANVQNKKVLLAAKDLVKVVDNIRVEVSSRLLEGIEEGSEESQFIETILYGQPCKYLGPAMGSCNVLLTRGYKTGLVYILSSLSNFANTWIQTYEGSNKTVAALRDANERYYEGLTLIQQVTRQGLMVLSDFIDKKFEADLDHTHKDRVYIVVGYVLLVVVVSLLVWRIVLMKFRETINDFKMVLSVLPGDLVLASFILRNVLIKTSKGILDHIKNDF